jgi:tagatose 6-phosphate kinase
MILCVGATPAAQRVMIFRNLVLDSVNRAVRTLDGAAGKSVNVAKVLRALGETPVALGFFGGDRGNEISATLKVRGIELDPVAVDARTRQCITVIDESKGSVTELVEESPPVPESAYEMLINKIRQRIGACRAVVMSGTLTPGGPVDLYRRCVQWGREAGALSVVDAQGVALIEALKAGPGLVKPNRVELAATVGCQLEDDAAVISAMAELRSKGAERVVVTAGKELCLASDGRDLWRIRPPQIQAINPIGSGDAFTAGLVWRLARGDDLGEACRWAAASGAANAVTAMAGEIDPKQVSSLVNEVLVERL